jgi:Tfp pilus assembly protein PilO
MRLPIKRIFQEKRRFTVPVLAGLVLNLALYAGVVFPLGARVRGVEAQTQASLQQLQAAQREANDTRNMAQGRDRTSAALTAFYKDVLPPNFAQARGAAYLRLSQLAEQHNLDWSNRQADREFEKDSSLARMRISMSLRGDYDDIRRFIYQVESGTDFIVIDSISLRQGAEAGSALTFDLNLSTYYRVGPDGE